jgi:NAD(P)-dependent dehydrogenase (short-subunit alcohol dehydrogenase family)
VRVAILDVNETAAVETARETSGFAITADVTDAGSVEAAVAAARERHGPARIVVNCAGIGTAGWIVGRDGPMPLDAFRRDRGQSDRQLQCPAARSGRHEQP